MPTPRNGYWSKDGQRLPSVTTILGRFKDSGALIKWAYSTGRDHGRLEAQGHIVPASLYEVSGKAADIGTAAHAMVEAYIKGNDPSLCEELASLGDDSKAKARNAFETYLSWASMSKLEVLEQEVYLISQEYRYGGTPDAIGLVNGELCLVDWKTSNSVYGDYLLQLAAYRQLWEENHPNKLLAGGFHLCRFSKDFGDFSHHYYKELDGAWEMFKHLRAAYDLDKIISKRAA
jgi:hypothetical protein